MIAVVDYGVGNLFSLKASLAACYMDSLLTRNPEKLQEADGIILPGVGAFQDAEDKLSSYGLTTVLRQLAQQGKPILGICLGMQLLFEKSYEYGEHEGLGLLPGEVISLRDSITNPKALVPHMGWNELKMLKQDTHLLQDIPNQSYVYYVHSYYASHCEEVLIAGSEYEGVFVPGVVGQGNVYGTQFHPEKSGSVGLRILKNFESICRK